MTLSNRIGALAQLTLQEPRQAARALLAEGVPIAPDTTAASLHDALSALGARLVVAALDGLAAGTLVDRGLGQFFRCRHAIALPASGAMNNTVDRASREILPGSALAIFSITRPSSSGTAPSSRSAGG